MTIRTKICGFTRPEDAVAAAQLGVDAIGLVFYPHSKRHVSIAQAQHIVQALPPFVNIVALFVNEQTDTIKHILQHVPIDTLQFHGDENAAFCRQFQRPYLKAIRVQNTTDIVQASQLFPDARALLFDAYVEGEYGGTGHHFDWQLLPSQLTVSWILSGGLNSQNITEALRSTGARNVDVSSGVESTAGVKSLEKMTAFLNACQQYHY